MDGGVNNQHIQKAVIRAFAKMQSESTTGDETVDSDIIDRMAADLEREREKREMRIVISEDCVQDEDGTFVCWNAEKHCFYRFSAKKETLEGISPKTLGKLVELLGERKVKSNGA